MGCDLILPGRRTQEDAGRPHLLACIKSEPSAHEIRGNINADTNCVHNMLVPSAQVQSSVLFALVNKTVAHRTAEFISQKRQSAKYAWKNVSHCQRPGRGVSVFGCNR